MRPVSPLARWRVSLRIARALSRRALGNSALIVALIALPAAAAGAGAVVVASMTPTPQEQASVMLGRAAASVRLVTPGRGIEQSPTAESWGSATNAGTPDPRSPTTLARLLPAHSGAVVVLPGTAVVRTAHGRGTLDEATGAVWSPVLRGRYETVAGRTPRAPDEIMATPAALRRLGAALGSTVQVLAPRAADYTVVGTIDPRTQPRDYEALYGEPGAFGTPHDTAEAEGAIAYLPHGTYDWAAVRRYNSQGALVVSREVLDHPPAHPGWTDGSAVGASLVAPLGIVAGFGMLEVALLAGAAFLIGARSSERQLAVIGSVGGTRGTLAGVVTARGVLLGSIGGTAGAAAGIGIAALAMAVGNDGSATRFWGFHVPWWMLILIAAVSALVSTAAAGVAAARASRIDIVAALRGARRPAPPRRRQSVTGLVLVGLGAVVVLAGGIVAVLLAVRGQDAAGSSLLGRLMVGLLIAGPALLVLGLALCGGAVLRAVARVTSRGPLGLRIAARDAERNRLRTVPAFVAVLASVFAAVFLMGELGSSEATAAQGYQYLAQPGQVTMPASYVTDDGVTHPLDPRTLAAQARAVFAGARTAVVDGVADPFALVMPTPGEKRVPGATLLPRLDVADAGGCADRAETAAGPGSDRRCSVALSSLDPSIIVGDAADLAVIAGRGVPATVRRGLAAGEAVLLDPIYAANGTASIQWRPASAWRSAGDPAGLRGAPTRVDTLHTVPLTMAETLPYGIFVSTRTAQRLHLTASPLEVVVQPRSPATQAQLDDLAQRVATPADTLGSYDASVENGPPSEAWGLSWLLFAIAAAVAVGAAAVAIALSREDARRDGAAMTAVGAGGGIRRRIGFWDAIITVGLGTTLGAASGLFTVFALCLPGSGMTFSPPWPQVVAAAAGLPLVIGCLCWLVPPRGQRLPQRAALA